MYTIGIDAGSRTTKIVIYNVEDHTIRFQKYLDSGINPGNTANQLIDEGLEHLGISRNDIIRTFATGYSRNMVDFAGKTLSEISCHAVGVRYFYPDTGFIIDVGGQDSKVIAIGEDGKVSDFAMNDKCAAGTGRFLEVTARILQCDVNDLSNLSRQSDQEIDINSTCVVFAESEIIGLISQGHSIPNIIQAVHVSIAKRLVHLASQVRWKPPIVFTGGVARNQALVDLCAKDLQIPIQVPDNPSITAALGAAVLASVEQDSDPAR